MIAKIKIKILPCKVKQAKAPKSPQNKEQRGKNRGRGKNGRAQEHKDINESNGLHETLFQSSSPLDDWNPVAKP